MALGYVRDIVKEPDRYTHPQERIDMLESRLYEIKGVAEHPGFASRSGELSEALEVIAEIANLEAPYG